MLCADFVPRSYDSALEQRESGFDGVRVNVSAKANVLFAGVINRLMPHPADSVLVGRKFVGDDHFNVLADVLSDVLCKRSPAGVRGVEETALAAALADADHGLFGLVSLTAGNTVLATAHVGFVHLDSAIEHRAVNLGHCSADSMTE